ncbi:MAG TPA: DinB family protein [Candidatus Sulfotelmatobacter sp.]
MTKDDIQLLYEYDRWANSRVLQAASRLSTEQVTRDLGGSFHSVRDTLLHIISGEWIWLQYWREKSHGPTVLENLKKRREAVFNPSSFPDMGTLQLKWAETEKEIAEFLDCLPSDGLETMLPARDTQIKLAHLMQHLANHSTYHRGQISLMMRQLGAEPPATDFHVFIAQRREGER